MADIKNDNELVQMVSFILDKEEYGVDISSVREIIKPLKIAKIPNTPHDIEGIISLRGKIIPIVSLRKKFNLGENKDTESVRIIVIELKNELVGFIVDSVSEVIRINSNDIKPPPPATHNNDNGYIKGVFNHKEKILTIMDIGEVV